MLDGKFEMTNNLLSGNGKIYDIETGELVQDGKINAEL